MKIYQILALIFLIIFTILSRMVHIDGLMQFNALLASAAFMGFVIKDAKWAYLSALGMMIVSDMILGAYDWQLMMVVYLGILAIVYIARNFQNYDISSSLWMAFIAPIVFFVISNLGVFFTSGMYEMSAAGLAKCFTMALPFARGTFLGTLVYSMIYFVAYHQIYLSQLKPQKAER